MATQVLVIFLIRTAGPAWQAARPAPVLVATSLGALAVALALALGPLAPILGLAPMRRRLLGAIGLPVLLYLAAAEGPKRLVVR